MIFGHIHFGGVEKEEIVARSLLNKIKARVTNVVSVKQREKVLSIILSLCLLSYYK